MTFQWYVVRGSDGTVEAVEGYDSIDDALVEMANASDDLSNEWLSYLVDEAGTIVATAIYAGQELLVSCADGRRLTFSGPDEAESDWLTPGPD
jgi:demethoxyubiquinone hydroxylase (CLK1/Coq7/Cat5 family)